MAQQSPFEVVVAGEAASETVRLACTLNSPATPDSVAEAELRLGTALPADYKRFLLHGDGGSLFEQLAADGEHRSGGARLLGTASLVAQAEAMAGDYGDGCIPELVIFATLGEEGDRLAFETRRMNPYGGCGVLDARPDYRPDQWWIIARDFMSWLEDVLRDVTHPTSFGRFWDEDAPSTQPVLPLDA